MYANDGTIASPSIIDASKLTGLYGSASPVTVADLAHFQQVTYMASHVSYRQKSLNFTQNHSKHSLLLQEIKNEPEDLTGNRRGSSAQDEVNEGLHK